MSRTGVVGAERPLGLAFLGCGSATHMHSRTLRSVAPGVRRSYASRDGARARAFRDRFGGEEAYGDYGAALEDPRVDVVLVATPPHTHLPLALDALASGKHVVVEKPAFLRPEDFDAVEEAAARAGRRVLVAENYHYKPLAIALRELLASGALGRLLFLHVNAVKRQRTGDWRDDPALAGGGALLEGGIHWVSLLTGLGLRVERLRAARAGTPRGPERSMALLVEYAGGAVGTLHFSWDVPSPLKGLRLSRAYGTGGSALFESNGIFLATFGGRRRLTFPGLRDAAGYRAMFRDFLGALREDREPAYRLADGRRDVALVEEAYRTSLPAEGGGSAGVPIQTIQTIQTTIEGGRRI